MRNRSKRNTHRKKDKFIFTNDLNLIKPHADYDIFIENFISRFGPNDIILHTKNIGFALIQYNDFCPINILVILIVWILFILMKIKEEKVMEGD